MADCLRHSIGACSILDGSRVTHGKGQRVDPDRVACCAPDSVYHRSSRGQIMNQTRNGVGHLVPDEGGHTVGIGVLRL